MARSVDRILRSIDAILHIVSTGGACSNGRLTGDQRMPLVGAVAAPHSHLQLFTRPAENDEYRSKVQKGREAMLVLREQMERCNADTILVIHDDHFVNFDFRCYPP